MDEQAAWEREAIKDLPIGTAVYWIGDLIYSNNKRVLTWGRLGLWLDTLYNCLINEITVSTNSKLCSVLDETAKDLAKALEYIRKQPMEDGWFVGVEDGNFGLESSSSLLIVSVCESLSLCLILIRQINQKKLEESLGV